MYHPDHVLVYRLQLKIDIRNIWISICLIVNRINYNLNISNYVSVLGHHLISYASPSKVAHEGVNKELFLEYTILTMFWYKEYCLKWTYKYMD